MPALVQPVTRHSLITRPWPCILCRSAGKKQEFEGVEYTIEELGENR
jgi:hypothetical protein